MSHDDVSPDRGDLRKQAAAWVARMQGPDAIEHRAALERWLAADPRHLAIYNRVNERFADAKLLRRSPRWGRPAGHGPIPRRSRSRVLLAAAAVVGVALTGALLITSRSAEPLIMAAAPIQERLTTRPGEIRQVPLGDGSRLILDTDSIVSVRFSDSFRFLRLERGRARFEVAHDVRPFVVSAGKGEVIARGTVFDVELGRDKTVRVALVQGVVDVLGAGDLRTSQRTVQRLMAGREIRIEAGVPAAATMLRNDELAWPEGMVDIDDMALEDLLERSNRYAARPIILGDTNLGTERLSGRFRVTSSDRLADNIGRLLHLEVQPDQDHILLTRKK